MILLLRKSFSLITNAKCLTEGIDVPNIDCIVFADFFCSNKDLVNSLLHSGMKNVITLPDFDLPRYYSPYGDSLRKTINFSYWLSDNLFDKNSFTPVNYIPEFWLKIRIFCP